MVEIKDWLRSLRSNNGGERDELWSVFGMTKPFGKKGLPLEARPKGIYTAWCPIVCYGRHCRLHQNSKDRQQKAWLFWLGCEEVLVRI